MAGSVIVEHLTNIGIQAIIIVLAFLTALFVTGWLVDYLSRLTTGNIYCAFGNPGLFISSFIGTPIHELGHLIMAVIFRHEITGYKLFTFQTEGVLGYVNTQHDPDSKYQSAGCFFIGMGPFFSGMTVILAALYFLLPAVFAELKASINLASVNSIYSLASAFKSLLLILFSPANLASGSFWLFMVILLMTGTHMSLSRSDLITASKGLPYLIVLLFGIIALAEYLGRAANVFYLLKLAIFICILTVAVSAAAWLISLLGKINPG